MLDNWTNSEKKIARRVFDAALQRELAEVMETLKAKATNAKEPGDLWDIEEFLTQSRHAIDKNTTSVIRSSSLCLAYWPGEKEYP